MSAVMGRFGDHGFIVKSHAMSTLIMKAEHHQTSYNKALGIILQSHLKHLTSVKYTYSSYLSTQLKMLVNQSEAN